LVWKDDPLAIHSLAEDAAQVAREVRAEKGDAGFWAAHDAMLDVDFKPERDNLLEIAKKMGVDPNVATSTKSRRTQISPTIFWRSERLRSS
jgi:hypothetical protein